jgi:(p)ppGpp synthase/HD superfamily hydrolase
MLFYKNLTLIALDSLLEDIGLGNHAPQLVARRLLPDNTQEPTRINKRRLAIKGTEGLVLAYARCCYPLPGDSIFGHLSAGRGIVVHRDVCGSFNVGTARQSLINVWPYNGQKMLTVILIANYASK